MTRTEALPEVTIGISESPAGRKGTCLVGIQGRRNQTGNICSYATLYSEFYTCLTTLIQPAYVNS